MQECGLVHTARGELLREFAGEIATVECAELSEYIGADSPSGVLIGRVDVARRQLAQIGGNIALGAFNGAFADADLHLLVRLETHEFLFFRSCHVGNHSALKGS